MQDYKEKLEKQIQEIDVLITQIDKNALRVRSKSELIIANMLEQSGIPYRYEYPLILKGMGTVRPDFTCLNIRTKKRNISGNISE